MTAHTLLRDDNSVPLQAATGISTTTVTISSGTYQAITAPTGAVGLRLSCPDAQFLVSTTTSGGYLAVNQELTGIPAQAGQIYYLGRLSAETATLTIYVMWETI